MYCLRSPEQITKRLDGVIAGIKARYHSKTIGKQKHESSPSDVLVVAHGHILRAFAARWVNKDISENPSLILEAGGVGTLRYVGGYF
jgi:sedoheptulose-bisphosphatase